MRTSNPALGDKVFDAARTAAAGDVMTITGTVNKSILGVLLVMGVAYWTAIDPTMQRFFWPALIVGFILSLVLMFKPSAAPLGAPVYAVAEGIVLGAISLMFEQQYGGIVLQAVSLTFATLFGMLALYRTGIIRATPMFKRCVFIATLAIMLYYLVTLLLSAFGAVPAGLFAGNSSFGLLLSLVIVGVAALNLVLDFDLIETAAESRSAPKYMEWYGAFALLVTLIWLYLEILRLLARLQSRD